MISCLFSLLLLLPGGARAQSLLSEHFAKPGVVAAPGVEPSNWDTETGKLYAKGGTGSSDSRVLRMLSRRSDIKDAAVGFQLLVDFDAASPDDERPWDGVHLWLRYQSDDSFYDVGVNRRDNTIVVKKKGPAPQGGSTFYTIGAPAAYAVPLNSWQSVRAEISDQPGGAVAIKLYLDGALALNVVDDGSQGGPAIANAGRVGLRGDNALLHLADVDVSSLDGTGAATSSVVIASATVTAGQAQISWRTSDDADSAVDYGPTAAYGSTAAGGFGREHAVTLSSLEPGAVYHYRVRSRGLRVSAQSADASFTASAAAAGVAGSSPTVSLTSPSQGQTLGGVVTVSAAAADGAGQVFVKFLIDGTPLGAELALPPYSISFNTKLVPTGPHAIMAVARNAAGFTSVATSSITISTDAAVAAMATAAVPDPNVFTQPAAAASAGTAAPAGVAATAPASAPAGVAATDGPAAVPAAGSPTTDPAAPSPAAAALQAAVAAADLVRAPERFLSPAVADGINDLAHFGAKAREVSVFDIKGRRVFHALRQGGALVWNGRDVAGRIVESGVYIAKVIRDDGKAIYQSFAVAK